MGSPIHHEYIRKSLAKNVRAYLARMEISENALAQKCKLSQKQVNNITNARTGCGIDALVEMSGIFGCEPWMLLVDDGDKVLNPRRLDRIVRAYVGAREDDKDLLEAMALKISNQ